ncbi:MAG: hypothetical protein HY318_10355 [Armatimonadetes bacterium]|nr:hypothetical protein [Armatimonadota bacterium]
MIACAEQLADTHSHLYGSVAEDVGFALSPYRLCPLGAHVDHQLGLVTGLSLDTGVLLAYTPKHSGRVRLRSLDFAGEVEFSLLGIPPPIPGDWGNYARGAALALQQQHALSRGFDGVIAGSLPIGGLSSSAAVGVAYLLALEDLNELHIDPEDNVRLDQFIENQYIGLNNGIMDQSVILLSRKDHLLFLDCANGHHENISLPDCAPPFEIAVVYSGLSRSLVSTTYNQRVAECRQAAALLLQHAGLTTEGSPVLQKVPEEVYSKYVEALPLTLQKRANHFFEERRRVERGVQAWRRGDLDEFGLMMTRSGSSSIHNYECGSPHLITIYRLLAEARGVYGVRFSGAGFRGCCVALIDPSHREALASLITEEYPAAHPEVADLFSLHFCHSGEGARIR